MWRCVTVVLVLCLAVVAQEPSLVPTVATEESVVNTTLNEATTGARYIVNDSTEKPASGDLPADTSQSDFAATPTLDASECLSLSRCGLRRVSEVCFPRRRAPPQAIDLSRNMLADFDDGDQLSGLGRVLASARVLDLSFNVLSAVSTRWTRIAPLLRVLDMSHNNVSRVERESLALLPHLRWLNASFNRFPSPPPLQELPNALRVLDLSRNGLSVLPDAGATHLRDLRTLRLAGNRLPHLRAVWFEGLSALQVLDLAGNNVRSLGDSLFATLTALQDLRLSANRIESLTHHCFRGLTELRKLDLAENLIGTLKNDSFTPLGKLQSLSLRANRLVELTENCFTGLETLEELDLSGNQLMSLENSTFASLTSLQRLNLSGNRMEAMADGCWTGLHVLVHLDISHNALVLLENASFATLGASLLALDVSRNRVAALGEAAFAGLTRLQRLDASENALRTVLPGALAPLAGLTELRVAGNPLLPTQRLLPASRRLQRVDASRTRLRQVPAALTRSVRVLALSGNDVAAVRRGDLDSYPLLRVLVLSDNLVGDVEEDALGRLDNLAELRLDGNRLAAVPRSLPASLRLLHLQRNNIAELRVTDLQGLPHLKELSLRDCALTTIDSGVFAQLGALEDLDLSSNPLLFLPADALAGPGRLRVLRLSHLPHLKPPSSDGDGEGVDSGNGVGLFPVGAPEHLELLALDGSPLLAQQLLGDAAALAAFRQLRELDLRDTGLSHLRADLVSYLPHLSALRLSKNPWSCVHAADALWLARWLRSQALNDDGDTKTEDLKAAACNEPTSLKGHPIIDLMAVEFRGDGGTVSPAAAVDVMPSCPTLVSLCQEVLTENATTITVSPAITTTASIATTRSPSYISIDRSPSAIKTPPQSSTHSTFSPHLAQMLHSVMQSMKAVGKDYNKIKEKNGSLNVTKTVVVTSNKEYKLLHNISDSHSATTAPLPRTTTLDTTPRLGPPTHIEVLTSSMVSAHYGSSSMKDATPSFDTSKASFSTTARRMVTAMSSIKTLPSRLPTTLPLSSMPTSTHYPPTTRLETPSRPPHKFISHDKPFHSTIRGKEPITESHIARNITFSHTPKSLNTKKEISGSAVESLQDQAPIDSAQTIRFHIDETRMKLEQDHGLRPLNVSQKGQDTTSTPSMRVNGSQYQSQYFSTKAVATEKRDNPIGDTSSSDTKVNPPDSFVLPTSSEAWREENLLQENTPSQAQSRAAEPHSMGSNGEHVPGGGGKGSHPGMFVLVAVGVAIVAALATGLSHCASRHRRQRRAVEYSRQQDIEVRSMSSVGASELW